MPLPSAIFRVRRIIAILLVLAIGVGVWLLFIRDSGSGSSPKAEDAREASSAEPGEGRDKPVSKDPVVRDLSVEEQVSQVLMLGFEGTAAGDEGVADVAAESPGAVLVRAENWTGAADGKKLVAALGSKGGVPPLIAVSQEGGEFRSLPDLPPAERALDIAREDDPDATEAWARGASEALVEAGFHLNLFPVADVATLDSPYAGRAFSDDPGAVAELTGAALDGCEAAGLACAPLHFPGLGSASQDTADGPATVVTDLATLTSRDLVPFGTAAKKAPAMVISLGFYPDFDAVVPGALTEGVATGLLRDDVGFQGVAISDDLGAGAVQATYETPEAAVLALSAGIDLIQIASPEDADGVAKALVEAVESGRIAPERLAEAAERVVDLKRRVGLVKD